MCKKLLCLTSLILLLGLVSTVQATTYYVSPTGNDLNAGTSTSTAWKTIAKVNSVTFAPGDSILFQGGQTFTAGPEYYTAGTITVRGGLFFTSGGTPTSPITVSSYGTGRATLYNPYFGTVHGTDWSCGFTIYECGGLNINNLIFVGAGNTPGDFEWNANVGILLIAQKDYGYKHQHVYIDNVEITAYAGIGIFGRTGTYDGWQDVRITNSEIHNIGDTGINFDGPWPVSGMSYKDFYLADLKIHNVTGMHNPGGSAICLSGLDGGLIEFCEAWDNGRIGAGIHMWTWEAQNVLWQFNEAHHHWTIRNDGGAWDLDGGAALSTYQYNYSHDNAGAGILVCMYSRANPIHDCIFRYNISANDCMGNTQGGATFYSDATMNNVDVYNNTFYIGPDAPPGASAVAIWYWNGGKFSNMNLRNNIFIAEAGKRLISYMKILGFNFQNNVYWQSGEPLAITDPAGKVYTSLAAWRTATGQEMLSGQPVGMELSPQLVDVHNYPTLGPYNLTNLPGYKLKSSSQCRDTGLNLQALFGINPGTRDYYNTSIPQGTKFDISAHEYPGGGSAPAPDTTPPVAPSGLTATATGSSVNLDWADSTASDISHYSVKRSTTAGGPYTQIISNLNASSYSERLPPATYYYVVTATDTSSNQSANSSQASVSVTYPGVLIFSDGFESGDFTAGGWETVGGARVITASAYEGTYGANLYKEGVILKKLSTVGYTNIRIRYMLDSTGDLEWGCFFVWWDGNLHLIEKSVDEPWRLTDIICGPEADNNPDFYFMARESGPNNDTHVDCVEIWGVPTGPPDTTPPTPNPMTWATKPYATSSTSIAMVATTATDPSGVEYFFDCTTTGGHDSVWQAGTSYTDTGLSPGTTYTYRVQARDKSANLNTTGWSTSQSATTQTGGDTTPPSPNPMTWATVPYATGSTSIAMVATTATDPSGVEYYFDETSGNPGGSDSSWQDSTSYTDTGLSPSTQYTYRVQARDKSTNQNATGWSTSQSATTEAGGGENLALNKPVTVSSTEAPAVGARAVDGSLTTYWRSKKRSALPSEWIKVDLGASYSISKVVLKWNDFWGTAYTIQVSTDDSSYTTVYSTSSGDGGDDVITFSSVSARYVKMDATGFYNNAERLWLNEYEVYQQ